MDTNKKKAAIWGGVALGAYSASYYAIKYDKNMLSNILVAIGTFSVIAGISNVVKK